MVTDLPHVLVHHFFVSESGILEFNQAFGRGGMFAEGRWCDTGAAATVLTNVVIHDPVETIIVATDRLLLADV